MRTCILTTKAAAATAAILLSALSSLSPAQSISSVLYDAGSGVDTNDYFAWSGADVGNNGVALLSTGSFVFFDTAGAHVNPTNGDDATILFNPSLSGTARFSVLLTEEAVQALAGIGTNNLGITGLASDSANNIYVQYVDTTAAPDDYFVVRVPYTGPGDVFGAPEIFIPNSTIAAIQADPGGGFTYRMYMDTVATPDELIFVVESNSNAADTVNGYYKVATTTAAPFGALTEVFTFDDLAGAVTPAATVGTDALGFYGYFRRSADEIIVHNAFGASTADGDFIVWNDTTNTASLLVENSQIATGETYFGDAPGGSMALLLANGAVNSFTDDLVTVNPTTGALVKVIATELEILAPQVGTPASTDLGGNSAPFFADGAGNYYFFQANAPENLFHINNTAQEIRVYTTAIASPTPGGFASGDSTGGGNIVVGQTESVTVVVQNTGDVGSLNVTSINSSGPVVVSGFTAGALTPGSTMSFSMDITPTVTGANSGSITINSDDANEAAFVLNVSVTGISPEIQVIDNNSTLDLIDGASNVAFGFTPQNDPDVVRTITINNIGTSGLTIDSISVTGTAFSITNGPGAFPAGIPQSNNDTFDVVLDTANQGLFSETVTIESDDLDEDPFTFTVTGQIDPPSSIEDWRMLEN